MSERSNWQRHIARLARYGGSSLIALPLALVWAGPLLAEQEAGGGGLFAINPGLMIWTWVIFIVLLVVLRKWAWGPILSALEKREQHIRDALDDAAHNKEEAGRLLEEQRKLLDEARNQAGDILAEGRKAAERLRAELFAATQEQKKQMLERARDEIQRERDKALDALRREAVDLSISAASRVLQKNLDSEENRRLVVDYLERLASENGGGGAD